MKPEENHPFADSPKVTRVGIEIPFHDGLSIANISSNSTKIFIKKRTTKQRDQQKFEAIGKSLSNVRMTEQLFASGKKQVIFGTVPSKSNCYKIITIKGKDGKIFSSLGKTANLSKYEKDFFIQCNVYRNKMIEGYLQIEVDVYYPNQKSDLDNSLKVILDCLQKVKAFDNDNKVTDIHIRKFLDKANPRVEFSLKEAM